MSTWTKRRAGVLLVMLAMSSQAFANKICDETAAATENSVKWIALKRAEAASTSGDATRVALTALQINNAWREVELNLRVAEENKCPARAKIFTTEPYTRDATQCIADQIRATAAQSSKLPDSCDADKWPTTTSAESSANTLGVFSVH